MKPPSMDGLREALGPRSSIHVTQNLDELDGLMKSWSCPPLKPQSEETLCFYGGDGSIARGLTALIRHHGEKRVLPPILDVRAGTINMLCSVLGHRESVDKTLKRWQRGELSAIKVIPTMKVEVEGQSPMYGFVFAWGVGFRVLREYYGRRPVPDALDASIVFARTFAAALNPNSENTPFFRREPLGLRVDGAPVGAAALNSLTAGTIPRMSLGLRPLPPSDSIDGSIRPGGFHFSANGMPMVAVAWHAPTLLFGKGDQRMLAEKGHWGDRLVCGAAIRELECDLSEGFTLDGEMFELPGRAKVKISAGPLVRFWVAAIA